MRRVGNFTQMFTEFGVIAKKPGDRTDGFKPDFYSPYEWVQSRFPRRVSIIDQVPLPRPKLMDPKDNKHVRVEEKSVSLLMEIMRTYCPPGGSIFDGFGGLYQSLWLLFAQGERQLFLK